MLYAIENALTIVLCVLLGRHSLAGLTASVSIGYTATALVALLVLARRRVNIITGVWSVHVRRSLWASLVASVIIALVYAGPTWSRGPGLIARCGAAMIAGVLVYGLVVVALRGRVRRRSTKDVRLEQF
jgi:peptidoglycan biosynthesis protein MviN/MurJ (putative lipid II flippase)